MRLVHSTVHGATRRAAPVWFVLFALTACQGTVTEPGYAGDGEGAGGTPEATPLPARVVRLDGEAYLATVATLFTDRASDPRALLDALPGDVDEPFAQVNAVDRFSTRNRSARVEGPDFARVEANAERLAARYVEDVADPACVDPSADWQACHRAELAAVLERLLRAEPSGEDVEARLALEPPTLAPTPRERLEVAVYAALMSPRLLFRPELGDATGGGDRAPLTPYERASALAYTLTNAPPDDALFAAAREGGLDDAGYVEQAQRLLGTEAHERRVLRFLREFWQYPAAADVAKDLEPREVWPGGSPEARYRPEALVEDTDALAHHLVRTRRHDGFLEALLTTPEGFAQQRTAPFYDVATDAEEPTATELPQEARRLGMLMQPAWLVAFSEPDHNSPIRRGRFIQESLLCGEVPNIPIEGVEPLLISLDTPLRQSLEEHRANPGCAGCHHLMDPLGYPLERFGLFGRYRELEAGAPVDVTGGIEFSHGQLDISGPVADPYELVERLAGSPHVRRCFLRHAYEFWFGRSPPEDGAAIAAAVDAYEASGGDFDAALLAMLSSPSFLERPRP